MTNLAHVPDEELDTLQGAASSMILIAATTENYRSSIAPDQKTIIGGFKSMTGMDSGT